MKLVVEDLNGRHTKQISDSLTITGQLIVSGDTIIAEISMDHGVICWRDPDTGKPIGWLEASP